MGSQVCSPNPRCFTILLGADSTAGPDDAAERGPAVAQPEEEVHDSSQGWR